MQDSPWTAVKEYDASFVKGGDSSKTSGQQEDWRKDESVVVNDDSSY